jgi:glycosyltransferase involved in cell wall biosynthesis
VSDPVRQTRVLVLSPFPEEGPGYRFRLMQYIPYLEAAGFEVVTKPFYTPEFFRVVYRPGQYVRKAWSFARLAIERLRSIGSLSDYDLVFIYREAFPVGPPLIELALASRKRPAMVFDFDDAIFLSNVSQANRLVASLKYPRKVRTIIRHSDHVIVGNDYLASYARGFNDAVTMIPTCVDTNRFVPRPSSGPANGGDPIVGWIGTPTTTPYLLQMRDVLQRVSQRHRLEVRVSGAGQDVSWPDVPVRNVPWTLDSEVELFNTCDVGIYPLPDDEWSKGKCGFKAIQFMACGVPVVAAAVGVNRDIIQDGVNGFLASTSDEWIEKIGRLLSDPDLRARFAVRGRRTIEERYSLAVNAPKLVATLRGVLERSRCGTGQSRDRPLPEPSRS